MRRYKKGEGLNVKSVIWAILSSAVISCAGIFIVPNILESLVTGESIAVYSVLTMLTFLLTVMLLSAFRMTVQNKKSEEKTAVIIMKEWIKILFAEIMIIASIFIISLIYGLIAVACENMFESVFTLSQIKNIINMVTWVLTIAVLPIFSLIVVSVILSPKGNVLNRIQMGLKSIKDMYLKYLAVITAAGLCGFAATYISGNFILDIARVSVNIFIGTISLLTLSNMYIKNKKKAGGRK